MELFTVFAAVSSYGRILEQAIEIDRKKWLDKSYPDYWSPLVASQALATHRRRKKKKRRLEPLRLY